MAAPTHPAAADPEKAPAHHAFEDPKQAASSDPSSDLTDVESSSSPPAAPTGPPVADDIPDGGLQAWLQVLGSWIILIDTWGLVNSFGVFQTFYEEQLLQGTSASSISWIGSLQGSLMMICGSISGPLYDAGYFRHLILVGLFLIVFGQFMTSLATEYWHFVLAQGICIGLGCGLTFLPSTAVLAQWFSKRRAFVIGIASTGSPLAGMVIPLIFSNVQPRAGFGWACRAIAFILLGLSVIPAVFMRCRVPPSGKKRALIDKSAFKDVPYVLVVVGNFFAFLTLYVAFFYIQLFAVRHEIGSRDFAPYFVTLLNAGSVPGRVGPNYVADKIGSLNITLFVTTSTAVLSFGWLGIRNFGGLVVFAVLYGVFSGALVSMAPTVVVSLSPDMARVGTRLGMMTFVCGTTLLVGTPIAGAILGDYSDKEWLGTIGYSAAALTIAASFHAAAKVCQIRIHGPSAYKR